MALVPDGKIINPGRPLELPLNQVAEAYKAGEERRAIKALLRPWLHGTEHPVHRMSPVRRKRNAVVLGVVAWMVLLPHALAQTPSAAERSKPIKITIGLKTFVAALEDNAAVRAI
jgi:hypothetical protein